MGNPQLTPDTAARYQQTRTRMVEGDPITWADIRDVIDATVDELDLATSHETGSTPD